MDNRFTSTTLPVDFKKNIIEMKKQLRAQIGDVEGLFRQVCEKIETEISAARAEEAANGTAWPQISWAALAEGRVSDAQIAQVKRRGCLVVRQTFDRDDALAMDRSTLYHLDANHFVEVFRGSVGNCSGPLLASRHAILPT